MTSGSFSGEGLVTGSVLTLGVSSVFSSGGDILGITGSRVFP